MTALNEDFAMFLDSARDGIAASASLEEQAAYRLAIAVIDDANNISEEMLHGFAAFAAFAHCNPQYCDSLLHADTITA